MKETVFPPGVIGFAMKVLASDEAQREGSRVAEEAYKLYEERSKKELPEGLIDKFLSWDRYLGEHSRVAREAYKIYEWRLKEKIPGTAETDWKAAVKSVKNQFIQEETGSRA
jgi:hypothetical protein